MPPLADWTVWITGLVDKQPAFDRVMSLFASDFFIPVLICLIMLVLWLGHPDRFKREYLQKHVMNAAVAIGISTLIVNMINSFTNPWPRPFLVDDPVISESAKHAAQTIFYLPHDPSFPSNATTVAFSAATAIWLGNRKAGFVLYILATLWAFARFYAGIHFFIDILAGFIISVLTGLFLSKVFMPRAEPWPTWALRMFRFFYLA